MMILHARPLRSVLAAGALGLLLAAAPCRAFSQAPPTQEYQLKAVFLFRFAQFADWPAEVLAAGEPLVIGVLGKDPFGTFLDETVQGERVNDHELVVRRFARAEDVTGCHVLFVSGDLGKQDQVLSHLASHSILTVSDTDGFARRGGMVGFVNERGRIRLHVNLAVAESAGLKLSSNLLRPAEIVTTRRE